MAIKLAEAERALTDGAEELDMVVNVSQVLSGGFAYVETEIEGVISLAHAARAAVKVIFENCFLEDDHKIRLCRLCSNIGADWVKTSTGFGSGGATEADVRLMRAHAADHVQVKASGGIRDLAAVLRFRELGATRVGTSSTRAILEEHRKRLGAG